MERVSPTNDRLGIKFKTSTHVSLVFFASLRNIQRDKGFQLIVLGQDVRVMVWIHYFIGDTEGNN